MTIYQTLAPLLAKPILDSIPYKLDGRDSTEDEATLESLTLVATMLAKDNYDVHQHHNKMLNYKAENETLKALIQDMKTDLNFVPVFSSTPVQTIKAAFLDLLKR